MQRSKLAAAAAQGLARVGRAGVYDVRVENQDRALPASFGGESMTVRGHWVEPQGEEK